jgi:hypothetical protein
MLARMHLPILQHDAILPISFFLHIQVKIHLNPDFAAAVM